MAIQKNFVVKNGIEVNTNLIFGDTDSNKVGIATTNPRYTLHVNGGIGVTNSVVTGVSTVTDLIISGKVSAGNSFGAIGQYLVSTGTGVTWSPSPTVRTSDLQTAEVGAISFNTTYTVGLLDVYINGVKLSSDEYTANNGATVVLDDPCFGGETVEFISYSPFTIGFGGTSIQGITILDEGSPIGDPLQITSINFVGSSITATGSGVGVTVSLSNYIDSAGISTYADTAGISTYADTAGISTNVIGGIADVISVTAGIVTATSGFVSIANTTPVTIELIGNQLTFNAVGIGSTTFTLF